MRAFYVFLERELGLPQADACLRVLGSDAVKKLEAALADKAAGRTKKNQRKAAGKTRKRNR